MSSYLREQGKALVSEEGEGKNPVDYIQVSKQKTLIILRICSKQQLCAFNIMKPVVD